MDFWRDYESNFNSAEYEHNKVERKNSTRRHKDRVYKQHLVFLADEVGSFLFGGAYRIEEGNKTRCIRAYRCRRSKKIKQNCNEELRRKIKLQEELPQRGQYRKMTEFWWEYL